MFNFKRKPFNVKLASGRSGLIYLANGKELFIDSEMLAPPRSIAIFKESNWRWNPPFENEIITESERDQIFCNVVEYFKGRGWTVNAK